MNKGGIRKLYRVVRAALIILAAAVLGLLLYALWPEDLRQTTGTVSTPADPPLLMAQDLQPNGNAYYRPWNLQLQTEQGQAVETAAYRGSPLLLFYWASWCGDCAELMPQIDAVATAAEERGATFLLVARTGIREETAETAASYLRREQIARPTLVDPGAANYAALGLRSVPSLLVFNAEGVLMHTFTGSSITSDAVAAAVDYAAAGGQSGTESFLQQLLLDDGGIAANFTTATDGTVLPAREVLSETMGLAMQYALGENDQDSFDRSFGYLEKYIKKDRIPWQITNGQGADANATLDDIRIVEALLHGEQRWGGYQERLLPLLSTLARTCAPREQLRDFYTMGEQADTLTLCYADLAAMEQFGQLLPAWNTIAAHAAEILQAGYLGDAFPLYAVRYQYGPGRYVDGDFLHTSEAMVTVYHLARAGLLPQTTRDFLVQRLREGDLYAAYNDAGIVKPGYAYSSTASYALLLLTACELADEEMARLALVRMEEKRYFDRSSPLNGGYLVPDGKNYTFDTMLALLAWQKLEQTGLLPI